MPRKKKIVEPVSAATKSLRRRYKRSEQKERVTALAVDFDWSTVTRVGDTSPHLYVYRCSTKCERASENPPLTPSGNSRMGQYKNKKGKLRWMFSFKKRSDRDEMLRECRMLNGCKAKKEKNRG